MSQSDTATFALRIDADREAPAEAAAALEKYRAAIQKSQGAIAEYAQAQRLLRGTSDEVKDAKAKLKAAIEAERATITKANLAILKLGGSYDKLSKAAKGAKGQEDATKKALASIGGPAKELTERFESMKTVLGGASSGWGALSVGMAAAMAIIAAAGAALIGVTISIGEFLLKTADANRNLRLTREAFSGSEANAKAWGHQIDWASEKTALTTSALNNLAMGVEKADRGTRISGAGMVHAFNAFAAAAGAGRDDTVAALQDIIERGKLTGRTFIGWKAPGISELAGKGIDVKKVFEALGLSAAQSSRGVVVSTDRMAAALDKVATSSFADINKKKMLGLGFQWDRLGDNVMKFTNDLSAPGGALDPILQKVKSLADKFDLSTESGQRMKQAVTEWGDSLNRWLDKNQGAMGKMVDRAIDLANSFGKAVTAVQDFASSSTGMFLIDTVLASIGIVVGALAVGVGLLAAGFAILAAPIVLAGAAIVGLWDAGKALMALDWGSIGKAIVDGLVGGLTAGWGALKGAVTSMGEGVKSEFKKILGIASPSKAFAKMGVDTTGGYVQGVKKTTPAVAQATRAMGEAAVEGGDVATASAPTPSASATSSRSSAPAAPQNFTIVFNVPAGPNAQETVSLLRGESVLGPLRQAVRAAAQGAGVPVGVPTSGGG